MCRKRQTKTNGDEGQANRSVRSMPRSVSDGAGATKSVDSEESPNHTAIIREELLTERLMERVTEPANMNRAYQRVISNKGSAGIDRMTVDELREWIGKHKEAFLTSLRDGTYQPQMVLGVEIPKAAGGKRQLGIPTVVDRLVQQAMAQVLEGILEPGFSDSSYGFRPGRGAHEALRSAKEYVARGHEYVVDIDLEKFFDRVNHDILMSRLEHHVKDKRFLKIVRRFLEVGMMRNGVVVERMEGTPQGGPLSPLLSNLLLDDLDKELEKRGHVFCRYADDCNIYVCSRKAGERVMSSIRRFLERKLKLVVNEAKSAVDFVWKRKFLGYRLGRGGKLQAATESLQRFKDKIRKLTRRNQGREFEEVIRKVNSFLQGWFSYFKYGLGTSQRQKLDEWIRHKLRCYRLKQCKRAIGIARFLQSLGVPERSAWMLALSGKGWWRLSLAWQSARAMNLAWFRQIGLISLNT